jgi:hypothetical protein
MPSYTLNAVKSFENYGLSIHGSTVDPAFTKGFFSSSPNVSIVGNSCFIDYSNTTNLSDLSYIIKLFALAPSGTTYSLSSGDYNDELKGIRTDISGVFSKLNLVNDNKLIIGQIVSGLTNTSSYSYYDKNYFVSSPQYSTEYRGNTTSTNYILNNISSNVEKSFFNAGVIGNSFGKEEYVEINQSSLNNGKLKINSVLKLKDNKEILYTENTLSNENLGATAAICTFYIRGNANPEILNKSRKPLGCYVVFDSDGNQINCYENQNRLQAFLRAQNENPSYSSFWVPCLDCARLTDTALNAATSDKSLIFDNIVFFYITEQTSFALDNSSQPYLEYIYTLYSNASGNNNLLPTSSITFNIDYGFKIDLSHPTLKQYNVNFYLDSEKTIPITEHIYKIGLPGYDQASIIYQKTMTSPKVVYIELVGPSTFNVEVTVE